MNPSDPDIERLLRDACPPMAPSAPLDRAVRRAFAGGTLRRVARLALPYAAGIATMLVVERIAAPHASTTVSRDLPSLLPIADRLPPPPAVPAAGPPADPAPVVAVAPVPRIS